MKKMLFFFAGLIWSSFYLSHSMELEYPAHFPPIHYDLSQNPLDTNKIQLGRKLFYDPILSDNGMISCASCHSPYNAFAHTDHDLSHGIHDSIGQRNAPALFNLAWQSSFHWDGAIHHLELQALAPINEPGEMGSTTADVIARLNQDSVYQQLFHQAFGDPLITTTSMLKSITQFMLTLISANSKYDQMIAGQLDFSEQEQKGYALFQAHCNTCHQEPLFSNHGFHSNGLALDSSLLDYGRGSLSHRLEDTLRFKVPSLRNLSYTYPYMHDGRFNKIRAVIEHYNTIDTSAFYLDPKLRSPIRLSSNEKTDLIAFLLTLNDPQFVFNKQHHFPRE